MAMFCRPPPIPSRGLVSLLRKYFPFDVVEESSFSELDGYDDRNYKFNGQLKRDVTATKAMATSNWFVAKFLNSRDSKNFELVDGLVKLTKFVHGIGGLKCPYPIPSTTPPSGYEVVTLSHNELIAYSNGVENVLPSTTNTDDSYCLRVFVYIEGDVLGYGNHSPVLLHELGSCLGKLNKELMGFTHEGLAKRFFEEWDLKLLLSRRKLVPVAINDQRKEDVLNRVLDYFETYVIPVMDKIEYGCIHNDFNAMNIIVNTADPSPSINGIIDFSDCVFAPHVFDLGIALAYMMAHRVADGEDPINYVKPIIDGYLSVHPLSHKSLDILYYIILGRAAQSYINSTSLYHHDPSNEYLLIDSKPFWQLMNLLLDEGKKKIYNKLGIDQQ